MSAAPTPYNPSYNFSGFQATNPTTPLPAQKLDTELYNVSTATKQTITRLALLQRDDGVLSNGIVTLSSLATDVSALISTSFNYRGVWVTATHYAYKDFWTHPTSGTTYVVTNTGGYTSRATPAMDIAAGDVQAFVTGNPPPTDAGGIPYGRGYYNVLDFGAAGDGSTDDSAAFQAAIDAAGSSPTAKSVFVPNTSGGYAFGSTVFIPGGVYVYGSNYKGGRLSRIKPTPSNSDPFFRTKDFGVTRQGKMGVIGLTLDGSSTTLVALDFFCQESVIRDCSIYECWTYGIRIGGINNATTDGLALNNWIENNFIHSASAHFYDGILLDTYGADTFVRGNYIENCTNCGIRSFSYNDTICNNHIYKVTTHYRSETAADKNILGNYFENCDGTSVVFAAGASDLGTIAGCLISNVFRNVNKGGTGSGVVECDTANIDNLVISNNVVRRDSATSYATAYFVYFNGVTPTRTRVFANTWATGCVTTSEANVKGLGYDSDGRGGTTAPSITAGTGAGTAPTVSVTGNGRGGQISITTGTSPSTAATIATMTYATAYSAAPSAVVITPANAATAALTSAAPYISASNAGNFVMTSNASALTGSTAYKWNYSVIP